MSHYYTKDGIAAHFQPCVSKTAKNPTRPTTITDAKKLGLLPSVSGITDVLAKPQLVAYIATSIAEQCFDSPPHPGEDRKEYAKAMVKKGSEEGEKAADVGTAIHAAIEGLLTNQLVDTDQMIVLASGITVTMGEMVWPAIRKMKDMGLEIQHSEKVLVNRYLGYAGTTDIIFKTDDSYGVLDFKSRKTYPGKPVEPYDTQPAQIAAYIAAHWQTDRDISPFGSKVRGINLFISTTEPGRVEVAEYGYDRLVAEYEFFKHCHAIWCHKNEYSPAF